MGTFCRLPFLLIVIMASVLVLFSLAALIPSTAYLASLSAAAKRLKSTSPVPSAAALPAAAKLLASSSRTVAAIVEPRPLNNLVPVLLHFSAFLGPSWPIHVFHGVENEALLLGSRRVSQLVESGGIVLRPLPSAASFRNHDAVSEFFTSEWFWTRLRPAEHVLVFQLDSMLCGNSNQHPEDYLEYAFVGAPIAPRYGVGYNGGLSLRNVSTMLKVVRTFRWADTRDFEDQWFSKRILELGDPSIKLPSAEEAQRFAVETAWSERPMGFHQPKRWQPQHMPEILQWCPEVAIAEEGQLYKGR